ncbi:MAG: PilN domain-containing protein [Anaerolineae bacterium]|nr:PilN domain-containing protein [Anaerolineae bacterium]
MSEMPEMEVTKPTPSQGLSRLILWLLVLSMGILFVPVFLAGTTIQEENAKLQAEIDQLDESLNVTPTPDPAEARLSDELEAARSQYNALGPAQAAFTSQHVDWPTLMNNIRQFDATRMTLTGMQQNDARLTIKGSAVDEPAVMAYVEQLGNNPGFADVAVLDISREIPVTPAPSRGQPNEAPAVTQEPAQTWLVNFVIQVMIDREAAS